VTRQNLFFIDKLADRIIIVTRLTCWIERCIYVVGVVYGFNVGVPDKVNALAKSKKVDLRTHNIIYRLIGDLKERLTERLPPVDVEEVVGLYLMRYVTGQLPYLFQFGIYLLLERC
jgi:hypothetical protein